MPVALLNTRLNCVEIGNESARNHGEKQAALAVGAKLTAGIIKSAMTWSVDKNVFEALKTGASLAFEKLRQLNASRLQGMVEQGEGGQAAKEVQFELRETLALFHGDPSADVGAVIATVLEEALLGARGVDLASRPLHFILWAVQGEAESQTEARFEGLAGLAAFGSVSKGEERLVETRVKEWAEYQRSQVLKGSLDVSEMAQELSALLQEIFEDEMMELMRRASDPIAQLSRVAEQVGDQVSPTADRLLAEAAQVAATADAVLDEAFKHVTRVLGFVDMLLNFVRALSKIAAVKVAVPVEGETSLLEQVFKSIDSRGPDAPAPSAQQAQDAEDAVLGAFAKTAGGDGGGGGAGGDVGAFIATFVAAVEQIRWSLNETNRCLDGAVAWVGSERRQRQAGGGQQSGKQGDQLRRLSKTAVALSVVCKAARTVISRLQAFDLLTNAGQDDDPGGFAG
ncbi:hypothetical protein T484DRAFT_1785821 [Baffinella frigidus]|nr:hypothetical protein T484DRAFT_1785821 [Cryptophyta sp. CCMP2293]